MIEKTKTDKPKAISSGALAAFPGAPECHVLSNGRRVITQRGIIRCLTAKNEDGSGGVATGILMRYLGGLPNAYNSISAEQHSVEFITADSKHGIGWDAEAFVDICIAYIDASDAGLLQPNQENLAARARQVVKALAKTGIVALIDEATGYQASRELNALNNFYTRLLREEPSDWSEVWHKRFVSAMRPLYGKPPREDNRYPSWMRGPMMKIYNLLFGKPVMGELRRRNPNPRHGSNHHQYLQNGLQSHLRSRIEVILAFAKTSRNPDEFWRRMNSYLKEEGYQLELIEDPS